MMETRKTEASFVPGCPGTQVDWASIAAAINSPNVLFIRILPDLRMTSGIPHQPCTRDPLLDGLCPVSSLPISVRVSFRSLGGSGNTPTGRWEMVHRNLQRASLSPVPEYHRRQPVDRSFTAYLV